MSSRGSYDEKADFKSGQDDLVTTRVHPHLAFKQDQVDTAAQVVAGELVELDLAEAERIRRKIDWHIMPMMCSAWSHYLRYCHGSEIMP